MVARVFSRLSVRTFDEGLWGLHVVNNGLLWWLGSFEGCLWALLMVVCGVNMLIMDCYGG